MITEPILATALLRLSECLTFFPQSPVFKTELGNLLLRIIGTADKPAKGMIFTPEMRLNWLVDALLELGKWPDEGFKDVRGIYCCLWNAADGREGWTALPGFREGDEPAPCLANPRPVEQVYLPQPGDVPNDILAQIPGAAKRLGGGK